MVTTQKRPTPGVDYLLVVDGEQHALEQFILQAEEPGEEGRLFVPSRVIPPPAFQPVDPFSIPYHFILVGQWEKAAQLLDELDLDMELVKLLRECDASRRNEVYQYLHKKVDPEAMKGVRAVRENMRLHNAMTQPQWLASNWGALMESMTCHERVRVAEQRVHYRFALHCLDLTFVEQLATKYPDFSFGVVGVDSRHQQQAYMWYCFEAGHFEEGALPVDPIEPSWLEQLPPVFNQFQ